MPWFVSVDEVVPLPWFVSAHWCLPVPRCWFVSAHLIYFFIHALLWINQTIRTNIKFALFKRHGVFQTEVFFLNKILFTTFVNILTMVITQWLNQYVGVFQKTGLYLCLKMWYGLTYQHVLMFRFVSAL